jgi:hypothetical protein
VPASFGDEAFTVHMSSAWANGLEGLVRQLGAWFSCITIHDSRFTIHDSRFTTSSREQRHVSIEVERRAARHSLKFFTTQAEKTTAIIAAKATAGAPIIIELCREY